MPASAPKAMSKTALVLRLRDMLPPAVIAGVSTRDRTSRDHGRDHPGRERDLSGAHANSPIAGALSSSAPVFCS